MAYTIRKHVGLRVDMKHVHNGYDGTFPNFKDAVAWAHFKHDNLNNTYVCLDDDTILYAIIPSGAGSYRDAYHALVKESPWIEWDTQDYRIQKVGSRWKE